MQLAKDEGLLPEEAARRIARQDTQLTVAGDLRQSLGTRFGGAWIDHGHGGRLTVAIADPATRFARPTTAAATAAGPTETVAAVAAAKGLTDTRTVAVLRSETELRAISAAVAKRLAAANTGARHGLQSAIDITRNVVRIDLPKAKPLTAARHAAVSWASTRYREALTPGTYASRRCLGTAAVSTRAIRHCGPAWRRTWAEVAARPRSWPTQAVPTTCSLPGTVPRWAPTSTCRPTIRKPVRRVRGRTTTSATGVTRR